MLISPSFPSLVLPSNWCGWGPPRARAVREAGRRPQAPDPGHNARACPSASLSPAPRAVFLILYVSWRVRAPNSVFSFRPALPFVSAPPFVSFFPCLPLRLPASCLTVSVGRSLIPCLLVSLFTACACLLQVGSCGVHPLARVRGDCTFSGVRFLLPPPSSLLLPSSSSSSLCSLAFAGRIS